MEMKIEIVQNTRVGYMHSGKYKEKETLIVFYMVRVKKDGSSKKFMDPLNI
jgi:hypothetical protein